MKKSCLLLIILSLIYHIINIPAWSATRFYLPSSGAAEVSPAFSGSWNLTTGADRIRLVRSYNKLNTAKTAKTFTNDNTVPQSLLNRQYVSAPIAGQTITGTIKGQLIGYEDNVGFDGVSAVLVRVFSNNGVTERGTLLALTYPAQVGNEYNTVNENRYTPASTSLSSVVAQNGDRIVVEIGFYCYTKSSKSGSQTFGDNGTADLPEDQTTTLTTFEPWVEFSQNIIFPSQTIVEF